MEVMTTRTTMDLTTTRVYPKFGLYSKNILRIPRLRKNSRIKSRWGLRYHTAVHNAIFRKHCLPYMPTEPPAYLSEEIVESDPLYVCKYCKDCFRFQNSFEDHKKRRSWILGVWCQHCFITVCTHMTTVDSVCSICTKKNDDKRTYLRLKGLKAQKFGATKIFYNPCQLLEHMKMHDITLVDLGYMMLMPIPSGLSNWTQELEIMCEALMEHTFILRVHIMDWLKVHNLENKWWILDDKNANNVLSEIVNGYQGREMFKKIEESMANQCTDFDSSDSDVSKSSADEFDDTNVQNGDRNGDSVNIFDKNVTENEDNPCMSNDITFVDCGSTLHYFEPEPSVESEPLMESELSVIPKLSYTMSKKRSTVKKSKDIANCQSINKVKMSKKRKISSRKNRDSHESTVMTKSSNKKLKQSSKSNVQQCKVQSYLKGTIENSVNESELEETGEIVDNPIKIDIPFSSKKHVPKFNIDDEQSLQSLITNNNSNKMKSKKSKILGVQSSNHADVTSKINELPSRLVSKKKLIAAKQNSHNMITHIKSIGRKARKSLSGNSSMDNGTLSQIMCNIINGEKKQASDVEMLLQKKRLYKSRNKVKYSQNSSNVSVLSHNVSNTSTPTDSNESEIVDVEQAASLHNNSYVTPLLSSFELVNNSDESLIKRTSITSKLQKVPSRLIFPQVARKNYETISLVEQENGDLYMNIKVVDHAIKSLSRNICDTMFKLRQEMIIGFQHMNSFELKKRMAHLQYASEETKKVLNFIPKHILNEKLRAINTLQRILNESFIKCKQSATDDKNDDVILNEWETDLFKETNLCKCAMCNKLRKPKSYSFGFSKLSKNDDDIYCICYKYVCHECQSCQSTLTQLAAHQNFHKKRKPYICPDCHIQFNSYKSLEAHIWTVCFHTLKRRVFACKICEIDGFRDMESVTRHYVIMHSDTKVACEDCFKVFSSYSEYKKHAQIHSSMPEQNSVRLVICRLTGIIMRHENYMLHVQNFQGLRSVVWFKCPFCPLMAVQYKHIISVFNNHLRNEHLHCLPLVISRETLTLIFGTKYTGMFPEANKTQSSAGTVVPKIVNTETITSETFERVPPDISYDTRPEKSIEFVDVNSKTVEKVAEKQLELLPKILDVRSIVQAFGLKQPESENTTVETEAREESSFQSKITKTKNGNLLSELLCVSPEKTIESDNSKSDIKKGTQAADDKSNDESIALDIQRSEESPSTETNEVYVNSSSESSKSVSNFDSASKANTDGRIKVIDIRKICKPNIESLVAAELCDVQMKDENGSLESIPKPPPLARIPQYLFESAKAEDTADESKNVAISSVCRNDKEKGHIAIHGPTNLQDQDIDYLCHLCGEQINTSWFVVRAHFRNKHSDECRLSIITPQLQRISSDFINGGYKRHLSSKKKKSDNSLFVSKKKRRWTPKKYVDLSIPMGLCVEQETAEDGEGNFKCKRCGQRCTDMSDLREHIAANHRLKGRYLICLECGENFVVAPSLQMHLKAFHGIEDPITYMSQNPSYAPDIDGDAEAEGKTTVANQCHVCMAVFEDKAAVDKHLRVHGMAFLNRKRIEARNAQKTPEKNANTEADKPSIVKDNPKEAVKRDKPAETILEKLNAVI